MDHQFRKQLLEGELLIGTVITLNAPEVAEIMVSVGFDWLFIDAEHAPYSIGQMQRILQAAGRRTPALIRLSLAAEVPIKKALDIGAAGIIAPLVNTAKEAERVVHLAKYSPDGTRGVGIARAHGYGLNFDGYVRSANDDVAVVIQAEHIQAVENIDSIVQVPGIDAILVGPYDLSASLGKLGQVEDEEVVAAIQRITKACQAAGIKLGIFGASAVAVEPYIDQGFTLIATGVDTLLLGQAATNLLSALK